MFMAELDRAAIHLIHAETFPPIAGTYGVPIPISVWEGVRRASLELMEAFQKEAESGGVSRVTTDVVGSNDPVEGTIHAVALRHADLVVLGTHGYSGLKHAVIGSVAEQILHKVRCPVMVTKEEPASVNPKVRRILVPVDFSEDSKAAASFAKSLAVRFNASVEIFHAIDFAPGYGPYFPPEAVALELEIEERAAMRLEEILSGMSDVKEPVRSHVVRGSVTRSILDEVERFEPDLVVMGTRGHSNLVERALGTTAERTIRKAACPVIAVKAARPEES
jgi:nucleotide-binding universal stress UspA family protein